jgi:cellulose synthase/poly-beta-1,6-N-acetylglucosamine synthase-like glycosyltransferase
MTVIICVRDEELVIEGKLSDLSRKHYPRELLEVLVIDTGSSDRTMQVVEDWISNAPEFGPLVRLLSTTSVAGKSAAVNLGLAESHADSDVVVLTDADSRLEVNALERIGRWFLNPEIGAVCGQQQPIGENGKPVLESSAYRSYYNRAREAESRLDSTPIFEGSLAAYSRSAINAGVVADSNADDSQLAVEARRQGLRAIHDPDLHFFEAVPISLSAIHSQRMRRAQGLVRHLWRNSDLMFSKKMGAPMRMTMRTLFYVHIKMPVLVLGSLACGLGVLLSVALNPQQWTLFPISIAALNLSLFLAILYPPFAVRVSSSDSIRPMNVLTSFTHSMAILVWVHLRIILRLKSHIWRPIQEIRESINRFDQLQ